jgi:hypothetical protein
MNLYNRGERRYSSYSYLTSALDGDEWSASHPGRALPPGKGPPVPTRTHPYPPVPTRTHCTGGWVGPRAGLDAEARRKIISAPVGDRTPVVQSVDRHYAAWATSMTGNLVNSITSSDYPGWGSSWFSSAPHGKYWTSVLKQITNIFYALRNV